MRHPNRMRPSKSCPAFAKRPMIDDFLSDESTFKVQVQRLHQIAVGGRWLFVGLLWLTVGSVSMWGLRHEIFLWQQYFTWVAVRYGMYHNPLPAFGLSLCIGMTTAVLVWQSRNILLGIPPQYRKYLEGSVCRIRQQGSTHPLWKWVCRQ